MEMGDREMVLMGASVCDKDEEEEDVEVEESKVEEKESLGDKSEAINRSRYVREKVQSWMTGFVTEVKRKSPSMVHRWVSSAGEQQQQQQCAAESSRQERSVRALERIEEDADRAQTESNAAGLRTTIKSKLNLNELYEKFSKTRDITGLFQRTKHNTTAMEQSDQCIKEESGRSGCSEDLNEAMDSNGLIVDIGSESNLKSEEDEEDAVVGVEVEVEEELIVLPKSEIEGNTHKLIGNASSPKNSQDDECQFSFEDFSFIEAKTSSRDAEALARDSQKDSGVESGCEKVLAVEAPTGKPRRLNIGEIGRSSSAKHHPECGGELGTMMGSTKRHLLSDIGRRFSEMNESSSDCEFRSDSLREAAGSHNAFRPNSMPVSPKPRMILPPQHRESVDFAGKGKRNSLFREYSTQSDSSRCSSVESLLESRKPDAESILINLGFGPVQSDDVLARLPKRFLKPSQVKGIDTEDFLKQQQLATTLHDHSVLGYRGLVGNPHYPPSLIVAKIMERFQANDRFLMAADNGRCASAPPSPSTHI